MRSLVTQEIPSRPYAASIRDSLSARPAPEPCCRRCGSSRRSPAFAAMPAGWSPCSRGGNPASRSSAAERDCARRARRSHRSAGTCTIPSDASPCIRYPSASFKASAPARPNHWSRAEEKPPTGRRSFSCEWRKKIDPRRGDFLPARNRRLPTRRSQLGLARSRPLEYSHLAVQERTMTTASSCYPNYILITETLGFAHTS